MSRIFTVAEKKCLEERLKGGSKADSTGLFAARVRPKLKELIDYWFPRKKELKKITTKKARPK